MRLAARLTAFATVAVTGLGLTLTVSAAAATGRPSASSGSGTQLWVNHFAQHQGGGFAGMVPSPDGSAVFVAGQLSLNNGNGAQATTQAIASATGKQLWQSTYHAAAFSRFNALAVSPDGATVFATGVASNTAGSGDYLTVAYNAATGATLWTDNSATASQSEALSIAVAPDGSAVYVTGPDGTVAYNAATGATLWTDSSVNGNTVTASPDGSALYVANTVQRHSSSEISASAYNAATGASLWTAKHQGSPLDADITMRLSPDGSKVFIEDLAYTAANVATYRTVAYNAATGGQLWAKNFSDSAAENSEPSSLAVSSDGATVFVTGSATALSGGTTRSYVTVAYNASTGARLWVARLGGAIRRFARAIAASPDGSKVFVFGYGIPSNTNTEEYTTIAYNQGTGAQLWVANFANRGTANFASAMTVSPDGSKVFVTGTEGLGHRAIATVAYQS